MNPVRFDTLVKFLSTGGTRRGLLRASIAVWASAFWLSGPAPSVAAACLAPRKQCRRSSQCCSGLCRKDLDTCAPLPRKAFGCTIDDASCADTVPPGTACPDLRTGFDGICRITITGRPVCAVPNPLACKGCKDDSKCVDSLGVGARCVRCKTCTSGTTCICPFFVKGGEG